MRLSFLDATGLVRWQSGLENDDLPLLRLCVVESQVRAILRLCGDGMSLLEMSDQSGRTRTVIGVLAEVLAWVALLDEQQRFRGSRCT